MESKAVQTAHYLDMRMSVSICWVYLSSMNTFQC